MSVLRDIPCVNTQISSRANTPLNPLPKGASAITLIVDLTGGYYRYPAAP
jgi:hypothetical protein